MAIHRVRPEFIPVPKGHESVMQFDESETKMPFIEGSSCKLAEPKFHMWVTEDTSVFWWPTHAVFKTRQNDIKTTTKAGLIIAHSDNNVILNTM
jgi:hypothetical protein